MSSVSEINDVEAFHQWLGRVAEETCKRFGAHDQLGTANYIDPAARLRGASCIESGEVVNLARPLVEGPGFHVETSSDPTGICAFDRVEASCHGHAKTHIDALNHLAHAGKFYGGRALEDPELPSVVSLAEHSLFTRAVVADITAVRGTPWVAADQPVTDADIDAALEGVEVLPGDALVLYMGRDRYEAAGHGHDGDRPDPDGGRQPGAGRLAAKWILEHKISVLAWDFLDSLDDPSASGDAKGTVHRLLPTAGLILIDNCDLGRAAAVMSSQNRRTAAFNTQPLAVPGGTGSLVTPWLYL